MDNGKGRGGPRSTFDKIREKAKLIGVDVASVDLQAKEPRKVSRASVLLFSCDWCGFKRFLTEDIEERARLVWSPLYGELTVDQLAKKDVEYHNCKQYKGALLRAKARRHTAKRMEARV